MMSRLASRTAVFLLAGGIGLTAGLISLLPPGPARHPFVFLLLWLWPALAWSRRLSGGVGERLLLGSGLALLLNALVALTIHYLPGPISSLWLLLAVTAGAVIPLAGPAGRPPAAESWPSGRQRIFLLLVLLVTLALRLPNFGYKEIQGDEGVILVRAAAALTGDDAELWLHQKGPAEILLPLATWGLAGQLDDATARWPFAWAGLLGVAAAGAVGGRWLGRRAGLAAAALMAVMGFSVAFGRIVQYQALVLLWTALALLAASRYGATAESRDGVGDRPSDLWLAAAFLGGGLLAHYDAILFAPAVGWLALAPVRRRQRVEWAAWGPALALGAAILALFYLPYALSPTFGQTVGYLLGERVGQGGDAIGWRGPAVWRMMTFYNSTYYVVALLGLAAIGLLWLARQRTGAAILWAAAVPALFYTIVVFDARTHVYTLFPGLIWLAAAGVVVIGRRLNGRVAGRRLGLALAAVWWLVAANYLFLMFIDSSVERQRMGQLPRYYPVTWSEPPQFGLFGFPYQAGWRTAVDWYDGGWYASNEEAEVTRWYLAQAPRTHCANFDQFALATNVQDQVPYDPGWLAGLGPARQVTVNGRPTMRIYSRQPAGALPTLEATGRRRWLTPAEVAPPLYGGQRPVGVTLGDQVRLLGYDLAAETAVPGDQVTVILYWQALAPFAENYQVFTHLYDGQLRGQDDGAPECAINPTTRWEPGQIIADPRRIPIAPDTPPGPLPLLVGMYNLITLDRLPVVSQPDDAIHVTDIIIR